ncbi:TOP3A, partial [Symbiodinium necroappetens]
SLSNGRLRFRKGQSRAVQIFEFVTWFPPAQQKCRIIQTSTIGHIFGLDFEDGRPPDLADLFYANVKKTVEGAVAKNRIVEHIQELASEAEYLALWLDCDREGENICYEAWRLFSHACEENVYRAHFSALTQPEIKTAFKTLGRPDKQLAMAVDARQELDLKIGVAFTRLMTRTFLSLREHTA